MYLKINPITGQFDLVGESGDTPFIDEYKILSRIKVAQLQVLEGRTLNIQDVSSLLFFFRNGQLLQKDIDFIFSITSDNKLIITLIGGQIDFNSLDNLSISYITSLPT